MVCFSIFDLRILLLLCVLVLLVCLEVSLRLLQYILSVRSYCIDKEDEGWFDQVQAFLIRNCQHDLAAPLTMRFNLTLKTSIFSEHWRIGRICPGHKNGYAKDIHI